MTKPSTYPKPIDPDRTENELAHFHSRYVRGEPDECWIWLGKPHHTGYGTHRAARAEDEEPTGSRWSSSWAGILGRAKSQTTCVRTRRA